ncbi:hypothetical protein NQ314_011117 [Rhamnusium bicolor]|uniref:Major facilitator superfamily (MFS) profile domain-containing protein n=1 Tax=Rhamnusium bicolor TaxID=1586634 RepID=A0AAV8XLU4_9CUCU|nr:hypothetical protein NQ314_011117 [Rhamnusium bicolor]
MKINIIKEILEKQDGGKLSQYLAALSAGIALFTAGIHLGWPAPSLRKITSAEYPFEVTSDEGSYIAIISCVGHVIGGNYSVDTSRYHREKMDDFINCVTSGGVGEGAILAILATYIAEMSIPEIRGTLGTFMTTICASGCLFINIIGSYLDIHTTALICFIFPILQWLIFINFPESPYYLIMKKKNEEAAASLRIFRRKNSVEKEIISITADVDRQMSESGTYKDLFTIASNRKAFLLAATARIFQQFTGCTAYTVYYQILIEQSTNLSPVMGSSVLLLVQIAMACLASAFIDKFGRKPLFVLSSGLCFLVLFTLGTFFLLRDYIGIDLSYIDWFPLPMMMLYIIVFSLGLGVALNIFVSEIYSTSIKAKAFSLGSIVFASSMMASTKFYQYTSDNFGMAVPFYTFSGCSLVGTFFFRFVLPETKGQTLEAIQQRLKGNSKKSCLLRQMASGDKKEMFDSNILYKLCLELKKYNIFLK